MAAAALEPLHIDQNTPSLSAPQRTTAADAALIILQQYQLCNILMIITGMYDNSLRKQRTVRALITLVQHNEIEWNDIWNWDGTLIEFLLSLTCFLVALVFIPRVWGFHVLFWHFKCENKAHVASMCHIVMMRWESSSDHRLRFVNLKWVTIFQRYNNHVTSYQREILPFPKSPWKIRVTKGSVQLLWNHKLFLNSVIWQISPCTPKKKKRRKKQGDYKSERLDSLCVWNIPSDCCEQQQHSLLLHTHTHTRY